MQVEMSPRSGLGVMVLKVSREVRMVSTNWLLGLVRSSRPISPVWPWLALK